MTDRRQQLLFPLGETSKMMLEFAVTSGRSPEEILWQLDSIGIEWYVTNQGDLSIKTWQIAAENFVPAESVDDIRRCHVIPDDADSLEWVSANLEYLSRECAGSWIAVNDNMVVAASKNLANLLSSIETQQIQNPFLTQVPDGPIIWETAFANEDI